MNLLSNILGAAEEARRSTGDRIGGSVEEVDGEGTGLWSRVSITTPDHD